jgi:hypothetical protein
LREPKRHLKGSKDSKDLKEKQQWDAEKRRLRTPHLDGSAGTVDLTPVAQPVNPDGPGCVIDHVKNAVIACAETIAGFPYQLF